MKENKVLILSFLVSIAIHLAIFTIPTISKKKVKQVPLAISFRFINPSPVSSSMPKKKITRQIERRELKGPKKIVKKKFKKKAEIKKTKPLHKKTQPIKESLPKPKEEKIASKAGVSMKESPKFIGLASKKARFHENVKTSEAEILATYINRIRLMLEKEKHYPFLARKKRWEGTVYIKFTISRDGSLKKIKITQSSGFEVLDREAEATIRRVSFPAFPEGLQLTQLQLEVPIVFRLLR
ncbi:MAG: energy transducer TonB [Deltaproteobacteria bacterium]|nr:energy transducer TonB [Deltaproteobacteria bacterium]